MTWVGRTDSRRDAPTWRHRCVLALTFALALLATLSGCDNAGGTAAPIVYQPFAVAVPDDYVAHPAADGSVSLRTPANWEIHDLESRNMVIHAASPGQLGGLVNVIGFKSAGAQLRPAAEATVRDLPRQIKPFKLHGLDYLRVGGMPAARILYEGTVEGTDRRWMMITFIKGDRTYLVTFAATPENFDAVRPTFDQILASVQIK